jgi:Co/Zn/Cd efflux system component
MISGFQPHATRLIFQITINNHSSFLVRQLFWALWQDTLVWCMGMTAGCLLIIRWWEGVDPVGDEGVELGTW